MVRQARPFEAKQYVRQARESASREKPDAGPRECGRGYCYRARRCEPSLAKEA